MPSVVFVCESDKSAEEYVHIHEHRCWELVYYKSCSGRSRIGERDLGFAPNTFALIPPGCPHDERHLCAGKLCYIGFEETAPLLNAGIYQDDESHTIQSTVERIFAEGKRRAGNADGMLDLLIRELILLLRRLQPPKKESGEDLSFARRFIEENYNSTIRFADLAHSCGYGYDYFRHCFKKSYGLSPQAYMIEHRLQNAKRLLETSDKNCTEIAYACGFSDSSQFSTMFKKRFQCSPKQYQQQKSAILPS